MDTPPNQRRHTPVALFLNSIGSVPAAGLALQAIVWQIRRSSPAAVWS